MSRPTTRSVTAQVRALQRAPADDLVARYRERFGTEPASTRHSWLFRRLAWQLQADAHGGLSERAQRRLDALMAELPAPQPHDAATRTARIPGIRRKGVLQPGTVLEREYKGRTVRVTVLDEGVECEGARYTSLSAAARAVTGSKSVNGRLWMGLTKRSRDR